MLLGCAAAGIATQGIADSLAGLWRLQLHPARLMNDFTLAAGDGAALLNASLVASLGLVLVKINRVSLSGPTIAAVFTMLGFGLFGKTLLNCVPIVAGVFLASRLAGKRFREYILIALFGTAIGPVVTLLAVEAGLPGFAGICLALASGVLAGLLLPAVAVVMLRLHQGYNLYNMGFTTGFLALFAASLVLLRGHELAAGLLWNTETTPLRRWLIPALSLVLLLAGLVDGRRAALQGFVRILRLPGRLPSDFVEMVSPAAVLLNMGVMGVATWLYVTAVGGDWSGPVVGGMLTVVGFAAFGKHPRNTWPVVAGIALAALAGGRPLSAPTVLLAALFGTTLAPLAGEFGIAIGLVAGFLHLLVVERTGAWHAGIGLYNNGFAGGLTATLLVSLIEWYRTNRKNRDSRRER